MRTQSGLLRSASPSKGKAAWKAVKALLELQGVCDHALLEFALWPTLTSSLLACAGQLRRPTEKDFDELLMTVAGSAESASVQIRIATLTPSDDAVRFLAERSIEALQRLVLTALGVLQGKVFLHRH